MDMKILIDTIEKSENSYENWNAFYRFVQIESDAFSDDEFSELFRMAGLPDNAAEFMAEWYPESITYALDNLRYTYGFDHGIYYCSSEDELSEFLAYDDITEDEYQETRGTIIRDAAFDGVIVIGE